MSPLVPTPRIDRNGRVVTRHMRAEAQGKNERRGFPSPDALLDADAITTRVKETRHYIKEFFSDMKLGFFKTRAMMKTLNRDTLKTLARHGVGGEGSQIPSDLLGICVRDGSMTLLNDFADYIEDHGLMNTRNGYGYYDTCLYLLGLRGGKYANDLLRDFGFAPYSQADEDERRAQHFVIEAALTLGTGEGHVVIDESAHSITPVYRIRSYALVDYIKANPEKSEDVVRVIKERGISPYGDGLHDIEELMQTREEISKPLAEGAL